MNLGQLIGELRMRLDEAQQNPAPLERARRRGPIGTSQRRICEVLAAHPDSNLRQVVEAIGMDPNNVGTQAKIAGSVLTLVERGVLTRSGERPYHYRPAALNALETA